MTVVPSARANWLRVKVVTPPSGVVTVIIRRSSTEAGRSPASVPSGPASKLATTPLPELMTRTVVPGGSDDAVTVVWPFSGNENAICRGFDVTGVSALVAKRVRGTVTGVPAVSRRPRASSV